MTDSRLPQLAAHFGQLTSGELYSINEQVDQAQAMLAQSLGLLRECFAAFAENDGQATQGRHLERAMIALQSEDMVGQLLDHTRARIAKLAKVAQLQDRLISDLANTLAQHSNSTAQLAQFEARLAQNVKDLIELGNLRQPVADGLDDSGPVQLF